ncbi:MAG: glycine rich domain-containing protein [Bacilli bacterium]|nr:glycine rich domain-containing protein [Bacilli bacterium]
MKKQFYFGAVAILIVFSFTMFFLTRFNQSTIITRDGFFVSGEEVDEVLLSTNKVAKTESVKLEKVSRNDTFYVNAGKVYVGEEEKTSVNIIYPMFINNGLGIVNMDDNSKLINHKFEFFDTYENFTLTGGKLYNFGDFEQADYEHYILLENANHTYVNILETTITTDNGKYTLPINSIINFNLEYLNYYYYNTEGKLVYKIIDGISYEDIISFDNYSYSYEKLLRSLGKIQDSKDYNPDKEEEEYIIVAGEGDGSGNGYGYGDGEGYGSGSGTPGEWKYVAPKVTVTDFTPNVYSVKARLTISDPARVIAGGINFQFFAGDGDKVYLRKTFVSGGNIEVIGLVPNTKFKIVGSYKYFNEESKKMEMTFFEQELTTLGVENLEPITLGFNNGTIYPTKIELDDLRVTSDIKSETLKGVNKAVIYIDGDQYSIPTGALNEMLAGRSTKYSSPPKITSDKVVDYKIVFLDAYNNEMKLVNNTGTTRTSKNLPTATIKILSAAVNSVSFNVTTKNPDDVNVLNYRYIIYDINGIIIDEQNMDFSKTTNTVTLSSLDPNGTYSVQIVGDYDIENGLGTMRNQVLGEGKFTTSSLASLGFFRINATTPEIGSDYVTISSALDVNNVNPVLTELLTELTITVTDENDEVVKSHTYRGDELLPIKAGTPFLLDIDGLSSVQTYNLTYTSTVKQGSVVEPVTVLCSLKNFKTYKRAAEVQIQNEFVTSSMIDFDVRVVDLDGAVESGRVLLTIKNSHGTLIGKEYLDLNADYVQLSYNKLEANDTYVFTYTAEEYNVGYANNTYEGDKILLRKEIVTEDGISGKIELLQLLRNITGKNLFNIQDYDRIRKEGNIGYKEYDIKNNTVMFGAKNGYVNFSYFIPETYFSPVVVTFKAKYTPDTPNKADVYISKGVGQTLSFKLENLKQNEWTEYTFSFYTNTNYIGFLINETANQNRKTTVLFKDIQIINGNTYGLDDSNISVHSSNVEFANTSMSDGSSPMPTHDGTGTMIGNTGNGYAKFTNTDTNETYTFSYTGGSQTFTAPKSATYKIEAWGAQGGSYNATYQGGNGGYTSGYLYLSVGDKLYVFVGGQGGSKNQVTNVGGYNGGGYSGNNGGGRSMGGGGATDIRLVNNSNWKNQESLDSRIMIAAGGGGSVYSGSYTIFPGVGGGLQGGTGKGSYNDADALGGSQIVGGQVNSTAKWGSYGYATQSNVSGWGGGGGGGYYGGAMGNGKPGGGGSSYISGYAGCISRNNLAALSYSSYEESNQYSGTFNVSIQDARNELVTKDWYIRIYRKGVYVTEYQYDLEEDFMENVQKTYSFDKYISYRVVLAVKVRDRYYELDAVEFGTDSEIRGIKTPDDLFGMHTNGKYIVLNDLDISSMNRGIGNYFYGEVDFQGYHLKKNVLSTSSRIFEQFRSSAVLKNIVVDYYLDNTSSRTWWYGLITYNYGTVDNIMINVHESTNNPNYIFTLCAYANYGTIQNFVIHAEAPMSAVAGAGMLTWSNQGIMRNGYVYGENIQAYHENVNTRTRKDIGSLTGETTNNSRIEAVFSLISVEKNNNLGTGERESVVGNIVGYSGAGYFGNSYSVEMPDATNTNILTQDPNIGKVGGMRSSRLYYVSDKTYGGTYSDKVSKLALYDKTFQNQTLNIYNGFEVDSLVTLGYFPQVKLNDCMPKQDWIELPKVSETDLIDVTSVEEIENNADNATVILHINNPSAEEITKVTIGNINKVEILNQVNSFGKTLLTIKLSEPMAYKSKYYLDTLWIKPAYGSLYTKMYNKNERAINVDLYYPIKDLNDWKVMVSNPSQNYALMNDLNFFNSSISQYVVTGTFNSKFDGRGHTIRNITIPSSNGLWNTVTGTIKNLNVENYTKTTKNAYGGLVYSASSNATFDNIHMKKVRVHARERLGGIVGYGSSITIRNCSVTDFKPLLYYDDNGVAIEDKTYEFDNIYVGALAGYTYLSFVENSFAQDVDIEIDDALSTFGVGGLVGRMEIGTLNNSYAVGKISCNSVNVGGLVGWSSAEIKNVWSYVDVTTEMDYVGGIVGKDDSTKVYNSLVFGAVYSSFVSNLGNNVHRTTGNSLPTVQSNYAWDKQKYYGLVTGESSSEVLLSTDQLEEETTYEDMIGFEPTAFDFSQIEDDIVPKLKNMDTGEVFENQKDVKLETELFDVLSIQIEKTSQEADIRLVLENPEQYEITKVSFNYLNVTRTRFALDPASGTTIVDVHVTPERYYDSYILNQIKYIDNNDVEGPYDKVVRIDLQFFRTLDRYEIWQQISKKYPENYLLTADIDFRDPSDPTKMRPNINTDVIFGRLEGQINPSGENYKLMYYKRENITTAKTGFIKKVTTTIKNVTFDHITLTSTKSLNYINVIYLNYADIENVEFNNITINASKCSYLAPIGYHRGENLINIRINGNNITGTSYLGGLVSYMYNTSTQDITAHDITIYGTGSYIGGILATKPYRTGYNSYRYYGYNMDITGKSYVGGLFGQGGAYTSGIYDSTIKGINGGDYVGGIAGYDNYEKDMDHIVSNCTITAASNYVGGLHGRSLSFEKGLVTGTTITQTRTDRNYVGGAVGFQDGYTHTSTNVVDTTITNAGNYTGGLTGRLNSSPTLQYSFVNNVTINGNSYVGGAVGYGNTSRLYYTVVNANITGSGTYVGGVFGYIASIHPTDNSYSAIVYECLVANTVVTGANNVGGFVGKTNNSQLTPAKFYNIVIVANVTATQTQDPYVGAMNGDDNKLYSGTPLTTFRFYRTNKVNNKTLISNRPSNISSDYLVTSTNLNTQSFYTGFGFNTNRWDYTNIATYFPRVKQASGGSVRAEQKQLVTPKSNGNVVYARMITKAAPVGHELPVATVYSSGINTVNLEFDKTDEYSYYEVYDNDTKVFESDINKRCFTINYDYQTKLKVIVRDGRNSKEYVFNAGNLRNLSSTYLKKYAYIYKGKLLGNIGTIQPKGKFIHIYKNLALTDEMEVYDITTRELSKDSYKFMISLREEVTPLYKFEYQDTNIDTYYNYSVVHKGGDEIIYDNQILVKNGAIEIIDSDLESYHNMVILDNYSKDNYVTVLGKDGSIYNLKSEIKMPANLSNREVYSMSNNIESTSSAVIVTYKTGKVVVFDYRSGEEIKVEKPTEDISIFEYFGQNFSTGGGTLITNSTKDYQNALNLKDLLNNKPIEKNSEGKYKVSEDIIEGDGKTPNINKYTNNYVTYYNPVRDNYDVIDVGSLLDNKDYSITKTEDIITENNKIYTSNALIEYYMKESIFDKVFKNVNGLYIFAVLFAGLLVALGIGVRNTKLLKAVEEVNNGKN